MVKLVKVNQDNYNDVINLQLTESQKDFVSPNIRSLAQAWVFYERARPYAIYSNDVLVGFIMFDYRTELRTAEIWRFMISTEHQGKGYGKQALLTAIEFLKNENLFDKILINYVKENDIAKTLYRKLGFGETGDMDGNEVIMSLDIQQK
ncbi:MAG: N-acetyltransferase [Clostridiales bacterium]|nr:MAG: N-acetyltransferase [Clostridiales bacterium]